MKIIITSLLIIISFSVMGKDRKTKEPVVIPAVYEFKIIDSVATVSKNELYTRARSWMAIAFKSANAVIQMDDKEAGRIIGKGLFYWNYTGMIGNIICRCPIWFMVTIDVKDSKYRCVLNNFHHEGCNYGKGTLPNEGPLEKAKPTGGFVGLTRGQWKSVREHTVIQADSTLRWFNRTMQGENLKDSDGF